jgi:hypothetical protein
VLSVPTLIPAHEGRSIGAHLGNIKNDKAYDPFPRTGLVKEYEPFIRARVADFCKQYPLVDYQIALFEAVKIAVEYEPKFKPELKFDFSTPLRWELKGLKRKLVDKEQAHNKHLIHAKDGEVSEEILKQRAADDAAAALHDRRAAEEKLDALPVSYGTGGNAAKVAFQAKGVTIGFRLFGATSAEALTDRFVWNSAFMDRTSADLRILLGDQPRLKDRMRAVIAHNERMEREADQEAENRRAGDYSPVFLEPRADLQPDIQISQPRQRTTKPNVPKPVRISEKPDIRRLDPILEQFDHSERVALLTAAAEALRPALDDKEGAILDWLLSPRDRTLTAVAGEIDITKGYASKLQGKILGKLHKRMSVAPDIQRKLIEAGRHMLDAREALEEPGKD